MEAEPSRSNVTLITSVEKKGEGISVSDLVLYQLSKWGKRNYIHTHRPGNSSCPRFSASLRGKSVREKNKNTTGQYLD